LQARQRFWGLPKRGLAWLLANVLFWQPLWAMADGIVPSGPGSDSAPSCFVEFSINKGMVGVGFLDKKCREYLTYQFQVTDADNLLLTMATHREFEGDGDEAIGGESYIFNEEGGLVISREKFNPHEIEEARSSFEPSRNYEKIPKLGCYSNVTKADR
jgi:hypothetical protein